MARLSRRSSRSGSGRYRDTVRDLLGHQLDQFRNRAVPGSGRLPGVCHVFQMSACGLDECVLYPPVRGPNVGAQGKDGRLASP
jgi:hypothetical protein